MDLFSIDVTHNELAFIRHSLDLVSISGKDAKFLAGLQIRIENELLHIERIKMEEENKKAQALENVISSEEENKKASRKKE